VTGAASALPLGGCNTTILAPDPPICLRRLGFVTTQRVCVWRVMTKRTSAPRLAEGIPARQVGACYNALLSPGPPVRDDRTDPSRKMPAFDGEVAIAVAQLYLVHVFQRSIPAGFFAPRFPTTTTKTPVHRLTQRDPRGLNCVGSDGVFGIDLLRSRLKHRLMSQRSLVINFVHPKITTPNLIAAC
jgi:hypothetical protein